MEKQLDKTEFYKFIPTNEAAKLLRRSESTVRHLASKNEIPSYKRGRKLYFKTAELHEYIEGGLRN